jgi:aldose 1-epimerase
VRITRKNFGSTDGQEVSLYTLTSERGLEATITNYGGAVVSLKTPDRNGRFADIVLGYDTLEDYVRNPRYFGGLIGRHANRIDHGRFVLNGTQVQLTQNNGVNHLHGGFQGFDKRLWTVVDQTDADAVSLTLEYLSPDGEEGYPGDLRATVIYKLADDTLEIDYTATTDRDTIVSLTNHSYFNLAGSGDILSHELMLNAGSFTPVSEDLIPTGEIKSVENTPMDFRNRRPIEHGGYDHNFVLNDYDGSLRPAARLYEPNSGRVLEIETTQPGIQFYSGNFLDGSLVGKGGVAYEQYAGLCLEPQHFPDAPNHANFPSTVLRPGEIYRHRSVYRFTCA